MRLKKNKTDNAERVRARKTDKRGTQSNTREKMWEIWKSSGTSQHLDRQLSAVEKAQDKVFVTRKMVRRLVFGEGICPCLCSCVLQNFIEDWDNVMQTVCA